MRKKLGLIVGIFGAITNIALATAKLVVGFLSGSIAIQTDAVNNYSDSVSSLAAVFSFAFSEKKPDKAHPFGHGRIEYIIAMGIAALVGFVGIEFLITSVKKIISPTPVIFSWIAFGVVAGSILVKFIMAIVYTVFEKKLESSVLGAAKMDSFQDMAISGLTLITFFTQKLVSFPLDAVCGLVLALIIIFAAIRMIKKTVSPILGEKEEKLSAEINGMLSENNKILGSHDLMVHSYGVSFKVASVHAEMSDKLSLNEAHDIIDKIEKTAWENQGCDLVIHIDPVKEGDEKTEKLRALIRAEINAVNPLLSFHDFRVNEDEKIISFDLGVPYSLNKKQQEIEHKIINISEKTNLPYIIDFRVDNK